MVKVEDVYGPLRVSFSFLQANGGKSTYLLGLSGEVVGCLASTGCALWNIGVATVISLDNRELPALGVLELHVKLAVLSVFSRRDALACLSHEAIVQQSDGGQVARELPGNGAGRAASASKGDAVNGNLMARWLPIFRVDFMRILARGDTVGYREQGGYGGDEAHVWKNRMRQGLSVYCELS